MSPGTVKKLRCRSCGKTFSYKTPKDRPHFPFCSERCRYLDLGRWFDEEYAVPGDEQYDAPVDPGAAGFSDPPLNESDP